MDSSTRLRRYKSAGVGHCACSQQQAQRYTGVSRSSSTGPSIPGHAVKLRVWVAPGLTVEQLPPAITGRRRVRCGYLESKAQCHRVRATSTQSAAGTMLQGKLGLGCKPDVLGSAGLLPTRIVFGPDFRQVQLPSHRPACRSAWPSFLARCPMNCSNFLDKSIMLLGRIRNVHITSYFMTQ